MIFLAADNVKNFHSCPCGAPLAADGKWTVLEGDVQTGIRRLCPKCIEKAHPELVPILAELGEIGVLPPLNYGQRLGIVVGASAPDLGQTSCHPPECWIPVTPRHYEQCILPIVGSSRTTLWCEAHRDEHVPPALTDLLHRLNGSAPYVAPPAPAPIPPTSQEVAATRRESIRMNIARALALQTETGKKISPFDASELMVQAILDLVADAKN